MGRQYERSEETDQKILKAIALNGEYRQYDLPKAIGKSYRTVLRHVSDLEKNRLIKLIRTETSDKKGKERKIYGLTYLGLVSLLASIPEMPSSADSPSLRLLLNRIPDKNESLLIFFKREYWYYFNWVEMDGIILDFAWSACSVIARDMKTFLFNNDKIALEEWNEKFSKEAVEKAILKAIILTEMPPITPSFTAHLMGEMRDRPELRQYIDDILIEWHRKTKELLGNIERTTEIWEAVKKIPYPDKKFLDEIDESYSEKYKEHPFIVWRERKF